jgi:hypothetical protein
MLVFIQSKIFCLPVSHKKLKIKIYKTNFVSFAVWVRNLVSHFEGGTQLRVSENKLLRIFGPKREENGLWRKLHNDGLHNLYSSPSIVRVIKSRRMRWAGHVARMGRG